jgi:hypothetical protein
MKTETKRRSGRPKKAEADKVQYQRIAVYLSDYKDLVEELDKRDVKLTDAFTEMVKSYKKSG